MNGPVWRQIGHGLGRYRAAGLCLAATLLVIVAFPPVETPEEVAVDRRPGGAVIVGPGTTAPNDPGTGPTAPEGGTDGGSGPAPAGDGTAGPGGPAGPTGSTPDALPANCDPATGRIKFPSVFAPPCVQPVSANGGATYTGVTDDEILVVGYVAQEDPALTAILRAMGVSDSSQDVLATQLAWADMFQTHYETYGRRVRVEIFHATGAADDTVAARSDAVQVATRLKPFAVLASAAPKEFNDELTQRGIVALNLLAYPQTWWEERAPYMYGTQMSCDQSALLFGEYIGKRLAGQKAVHAGSAALRDLPRNFGLLLVDDVDGFTRVCGETLKTELGRHGVTLGDHLTYEADLARSQEQARILIARLKDSPAVTSVLCSCDPLSLIWFTQEATRQDYFPEWIIPGGTLIDTIYLGRVYDQRQWANAFGLSQLWIRPPQEQTEAYYQHVWHHGRPPQSARLYEILYQDWWLLFTGIHLAGPNLNPHTFRDGLFSFPASGDGVVSQVQRSFGNQGRWPSTDYTGFDTVAEVWWDSTAQGVDEVGNHGQGMWRWVDGGRRYGYGQFPAAPSTAFDPAGAPTHLDALPESDRFPEYPRPG